MTAQHFDRSAELSSEGLIALGQRNSCDREPIHLSGAIQPHGFLLVVDPDRLDVIAASANAATVFGLTDAELLGAHLTDVVGPQAFGELMAAPHVGNPHEGLPLRVALPGRAEDDRGAAAAIQDYDVVAHHRGDVLFLEFETSSGVQLAADASFYQQQRSTMKLLGAVDDIDALCRLAAREVRRLTGYDRVMIYRFDADAHGHVIAEARREGAEPFLGLHYPAGDIPRQARALYLRNWIRVITDVTYTPVPILAVPERVRADRLDLSMSVLRSVSPLHLQYLENMGVRATTTISLIVENQLWGLIACHHDSPKHLSHLERLGCEAIGQLVSIRIRAADSLREQRDGSSLRQLAAKVVTAMAAGENPVSGLHTAAQPLLEMVAGDGAVVEIDGHRAEVGVVPSRATTDWIVRGLSLLAAGGPAPVVTDALPALLAAGSIGETSQPCPADAQALDLADLPAGALYLPLAGREVGFVLWLRQEQLRTVRWAGRPEAKPDEADSGGQSAPLTPRASFDEWREQVRGRSTRWRPAEIAAATELSASMPDVMLHRSQSQLIRFAFHDALTGLPNRVLLLERLGGVLGVDGETDPGEATSGVTDSADRPALLFIDLDGFKLVNDSQGHGVGDELLALAAERLSGAVQPRDTVARMGGDEFVVLIPATDTARASAVGQRIVEDFRRPFLLDGHLSRPITASVGVALVPIRAEAGEALRQADAALYHAKRAGRNQVAIYDPASGTAASRLHLDAQELRAAIGDGQLTVHYQPVVSLSDADAPVLEGFEALVRWRHPTRGLVPPNEFIDLAEQSGLIDQLGDFVLSVALRQLQAWPDPRLTMAVNVSVHQLMKPGFVEDVRGHLLEYGIEPARLCLEITESQMMEKPELALAVLADLSALDVQIAIDDFGTGFSSLAYVRNFPATILKIDRSFVASLPVEPKDLAVVAAIVRLAHDLGMRTVAEGVETAEQLASLVRLGSDFAQGYFLGRPMPADEIAVPTPDLTSF